MSIKSYLLAPVPTYGLLAFAAGATAAGVVGTYYIMKAKFEAEFQARLEKEIEGTEKFFVTVQGKYATPQDAVRDLVKISNDESLVLEDEAQLALDTYTNDLMARVDDESLEEVVHNVFTDAKNYDFDLEEEKAKRTSDAPYILEHDEFFESENQTVQLTWYEGDEVLADEKDGHIPDVDNVVGEENLLRFGHGSRDPNILYIRNEKMEVDFEVVKSDGKYTEQVLGFIQHEDRPQIRRMRDYDE